MLFGFCFNATATTEIYTYGHTLPRHDALPIFTVARTANEIIDITDKGALRVVARGLVKNAKDNVRIERGSVVYVHKNGDHWEVINPPSVQAAFVSLRPQDGAIQSLVGGFDFEDRSEEHTSELQSLMRISYAVFCLKKKKYTKQ